MSKFRQTRIFPKNLLRSVFSVYSPLTSCTISEKLMNEFWEKVKKSIFGPFLPKFGQTRIFPKNLLRSVFSVYSPLTSCTISEKTNELILRKSKKSPFLGPFCPNLPKFGQTRIFPKNLLKSVFSVYSPLTSCTISEKLMNEFWEKVKKSIFGPFLPKFGQTRIFPKNLLRSVFSVYSPLTSCTISEKTNELILRKSKKSPFLGPFCPNLGKREFSRKIYLSQFLAFIVL